jgi:hypothetical protein
VDPDLFVDGWGILREGFGAPPSGPVIPQQPVECRAKRSAHWPAFLKQFLAAHPDCFGCGRKAVTGHHDVPFHVEPARELDESNILAVCLPCHFVLCHAGDWKLWVKTAREDLAAHLERVRAAQQLNEKGTE